MTQQNPQNQQSAPQQIAPQPLQSAPQPAQQPQQPTQSMQQPQQTQQPAPQPQPQMPLISFSTTAPEQTSKPNAYDSIITQQNEQIAALIAQNQALTGQITQMVQGGAQFTQPQPQQPTQQPQQVQQPQPTEFPPVYDGASPLQSFNPPSLSDNQDYSLEALASEIGKKEK